MSNQGEMRNMKIELQQREMSKKLEGSINFF